MFSNRKMLLFLVILLLMVNLTNSGFTINNPSTTTTTTTTTTSEIAQYTEGVHIIGTSINGIYVDTDGNTTCSGEYIIDKKIVGPISIKIMNKDDYQHNIKVVVKTKEGTWTSPLMMMPIRSVKAINGWPYISETGSHVVTISIIDENGKTLDSKIINVLIKSPIDIKNITCENSKKVNWPNYCEEYVYSPTYTITLKNNKYSQSDYLVKTWIAVVPITYTKDASKNKNDPEILYYGEDNIKNIYVPLHQEKVVQFKIPPIMSSDNTFKIQVFTDIMGVHHYNDSLEESNITVNNGKLKDNSKYFLKVFHYPVVLDKSIVVTNLENETVRNIVEKYYNKKHIFDKDIKNALYNKNRYSENIMPRSYVKKDPYMIVNNITLHNYLDFKVTTTLVTIDKTFEKHILNVTIEPNSYKSIYLPLNVYYKNYLIDYYTYTNIYGHNEKIELEHEPIKVCPLEVVSIPTYKYNNLSRKVVNGDIDLIVGKNYTIQYVLRNNYFRTLSGNTEIFNSEFNKLGIANYPNKIPFNLTPHKKITYNFPIKYNKEGRSIIRYMLKCNELWNITSSGVFVQAHNPKINLKYVKNLKPVINPINNIYQYDYNPVPGAIEEFNVYITNPINENLTYKLWLEAYDSKENLKDISLKKLVKLSPYEQDKKVNLCLKFNEGFHGYIVVKGELINDNGTTTNITTPLESKSVVVVAPFTLKNISYNNSKWEVTINASSVQFENFQRDIPFYYWVDVINNDNYSKVYSGKKSEKLLYPGENYQLKTHLPIGTFKDGNYTIICYVKIPNAIKKNSNEYIPMVLYSTYSLNINNSKIKINKNTGDNNKHIIVNDESNKNKNNKDNNKHIIVNDESNKNKNNKDNKDKNFEVIVNNTDNNTILENTNNSEIGKIFDNIKHDPFFAFKVSLILAIITFVITLFIFPIAIYNKISEKIVGIDKELSLLQFIIKYLKKL